MLGLIRGQPEGLGERLGDLRAVPGNLGFQRGPAVHHGGPHGDGVGGNSRAEIFDALTHFFAKTTR